MNDHSPVIHGTPTRPYLGLDYFHEEDAALFTERDKDTRDCASMLLSLNVKILVLQGSTGAGKSSFLRAGLIPRLRQKSEGRTHFLSDGDCVIRCTADPLQWIFTDLDKALRSGRFGDAALPANWPAATAIADMPRKTLADTILAALYSCGRILSGHLILILDQAEEVLTQAEDHSGLDEKASAFFYFLEEAYLRNIDVRIVVAMRTEYYGRFRDELRIEDDRLTSRPHSGGVEPFLLRPIRDSDALLRIIEAPAKLADGALFNFTFSDDAARRIVKDLLEFFPHGSVTPFLQVICAILYELLSDQKREITLLDYERHDDLKGIAYLYLDRGVEQAVGQQASPDTKIAWLSFLYCLTSTQGGGMVVSRLESLERLRKRAAKQGIPGDIEPALLALCGGDAPLLRGLPLERPTQYSLKHDVLAVVLSRWNDENTTAAAEREVRERQLTARKQRNLKFGAAGGLAILLVGFASAWWASDKGEYKALERSTGDRLAYAVNPARSDYSQSLAVMVNSITAFKDGPTLVSTDSLKEQAIAGLRSLILRSPVFSSEVWSAGFDTSARTMVVLDASGERVSRMTFAKSPSDGAVQRNEAFILPPDAISALKDGIAAAGDMRLGLGPVAILGDDLYYWENGTNGTKLAQKLVLPAAKNDSATQYIRYEIINGVLHVLEYRSEAGQLRIRGSRTSGEELYSGRTSNQNVFLTENQKNRPPPLFSDSKATQGIFAYVANLDDDKRHVPYHWKIGRLGDAGTIEVPPVGAAAEPTAAHMRFGFVTGGTGAIVQHEAGTFQYLGLTGPDAGREVSLLAPGAGRPLVFADKTGPDAYPPLKPYTPWVHSPLAAVRTGGQLKLAWMTASGIATASGPINGKLAGPSAVNSQLLTGELNGSKLQFSTDGELLFLLQQPFPQRPLKVRVWDLSNERKQFVSRLSEDRLVKTACAIVWNEQRALLTTGQADSETKRACPLPSP